MLIHRLNRSSRCLQVDCWLADRREKRIDCTVCLKCRLKDVCAKCVNRARKRSRVSKRTVNYAFMILDKLMGQSRWEFVRLWGGLRRVELEGYPLECTDYDTSYP